MTAMSAHGDDQEADPAPGIPAPASMAGQPGGPAKRGVVGVSRSIWALEHVQDVVTAAVGIVLIALACVLLIAGIVDSLDGSWGTVSVAAPKLLDRVLLVLILVEIVYTVVLSLQTHRLQALPFIVVGLVAVVRKILLLLSGQEEVGTAELALLIGLVAVFIAGLIAVTRFQRSV